PEGVRGAQARPRTRRGARKRAQGVREGRARAAQVPAGGRIHRRAAEDLDRQDPALQAARARSGESGRRARVTPANEPRSAEVSWRGRPVRVEYEWVGEGHRVLVFLPEGLGSRAMWRDFP